MLLCCSFGSVVCFVAFVVNNSNLHSFSHYVFFRLGPFIRSYFRFVAWLLFSSIQGFRFFRMFNPKSYITWIQLHPGHAIDG